MAIHTSRSFKETLSVKLTIYLVNLILVKRFQNTNLKTLIRLTYWAFYWFFCKFKSEAILLILNKVGLLFNILFFQVLSLLLVARLRTNFSMLLLQFFD